MFAFHVSVNHRFVTFVHYFVADTLNINVSQQHCDECVVRFKKKNYYYYILA